MKKKILFLFLIAIGYASVFAEFLGNKPSIDFVIRPEAFAAFELANQADDESAVGVGANGVLRLNLKPINFLWWESSFLSDSDERKLFSENIFGFYLKNNYSAHTLKKGKSPDMKIGGGVHGQVPLLTLGMDLGMLYSPITHLWTFEDFVGFMGQNMTAGLRTNLCFDDEPRTTVELLFAWNFKLDVRKSNYNKLLEKYKQDVWIPEHTTTQKLTVGDIGYFKNAIKDSQTNFGNSIYSIPVIIKGYKRWDGKTILEGISFVSHKLGNGKPGSDEYIKYTSENITLNFSTDEEKRLAFDNIVDEYNIRQTQKSRIAENKRLNPNRLEYNSYPVLSMATMGVAYAPNPTLIRGSIYIADQMRFFYIINRMENGDYNIGQDSGSYGRYQFILRNSSGESMEGIGGHMFTNTAYLRYLGTTEVIMSDGYVRYLPYFEMLKKNPHEDEIRKIIEECETW